MEVFFKYRDVSLINKGLYKKGQFYHVLYIHQSEHYTNLKEITLPENIILCYEAFRNCEKLRSLTLPDNVSQRAHNWGDMFVNCEALTVTYKGTEYNYTNFIDLYYEIPQKEYDL